MKKNYYTDTESIGFFAPTVLIQYAINNGDVHIYNLWTEPVRKSLDLIEDICNNNIVGFNLTHDWFHLSRTYNILDRLPWKKPPTVLDYHDVEDEIESHDTYCLKPHGALDLMLYGRTHEFQATMNQKPITIKRVPKDLAKILVNELEEKVNIPKLYFAKKDGKQNWKLKELHQGTASEITPEQYKSLKEGKDDYIVDPDFVNLKLEFHPSTGLKPIMQYLLNKEVDTIDEMLPLKNPEVYSWYPSSGNWLNVAEDHIFAWTHDKRRLKYAKDDVYYLRDLSKYFAKNAGFNDTQKFIYSNINDINSNLACMVGGLHWKGFEIDLDLIKKQITNQQFIVDAVNKEVMFNSPKKVLNHLHEVCNEMEKEIIVNTKQTTLFSATEDGNIKLASRAQYVLDGRIAQDKLTLLKRLQKAKRMYVTFKVIGTKTNRMSGGSMEE